MLSESEATQLQRDMRHELDGSSGAVLKSAAGLLIVVVLALFGSLLVPGQGNAAGQAPAHGAIELRV